MFVTKQVFDPNLEGKAVVVTGLKTGDAVVLIGEVHDDKICVVDKTGMSTFIRSEDFRQGKLSLEILEPKPPKPARTTPGGAKGRTIDDRHIRSDATVREDERLVLSFLQVHPNGLLLREIVERMNKSGRFHWSFPRVSPSGYIATMIKKGLPIEKVDYGRYRYKGGDGLSLKQN